MTREEYVTLYEKYRSGNCNAEELNLLETYKDDFSLTGVVWDPSLGDEKQISSRIYTRLSQTIAEQKPIRKYPFNYIAIAAAITVMMLSIGLYFYSGNTTPAPVKQISFAEIKPGGNKAMLTLDDGSTITLNNSKDGLLANEGDALVQKTGDGKLVYQASGSAAATTKYNTITIPRGGQYQLQLPDGTEVWLNAQSSLRFPVAFNGAERKVELTGEAYFEVAKNKAKPFRVISNGMETEVLGTHFNVNAYDSQSSVTLLEGSVKLKNSGQSVTLKPGEYGTTSSTGTITVAKADLESAVAWKNGMFIFHDENIRSIMAKVSRWYDVEISYQANTVNKDFYGKVSRYKNVEELLKNMELTGTVHFRIDSGTAGKGRRIIVMP